MTDSQCVDYLENICKMFVNGSKNCEGSALEYQQMYISAIRHAIAKLQSEVEVNEDFETQLLYAELLGIKKGYKEAQKKFTQHKPHEDEEPNFTSISTGYATYTAEDIRTCDYCKHNAGLPSNNGTMEYSGVCKNCVAKDMWEMKNDK